MAYKVLIADDETRVRSQLEKNLCSSGLPIEVIASAEDGEEALIKAEQYRPDIIITDIEMPIMNGLELIRTLQEREIVTKNIIISGYDEFDYARTAISLGVTDYLLKPFMPKELFSIFEKIIHELDAQNILKQNLKMLRQQADKYKVLNRKDTLKAVLEGTDTADGELEQLGFVENRRSQFLTCIISLNWSIWDFYIQEQVEEFLELVKTDYFSKNLRLYAVGLENSKLAICINSDRMTSQMFSQEILSGVEKLSRSMQQHYDAILYCSIGRTYPKISMLKESYQDALSAWKDVLEPQKHIWLYGEKQQKSQLTEKGISEKIRHLKSAIRIAVCTGKWEEVQELLHQMMPLYAMDSNKGSEYVFISVGELVYGIADDMNKMGLEKVNQDAILQLNQKTRAVSLLEIREVLEAYLEQCCKEVSRNLSSHRSEVVVQMMQAYVEEHLTDHTLSIEDMTEIVHFSVSYLRQIFKETTGENFNEYLIRKRMEKAGELLRTSSMKIQDVAEYCGYENQGYFANSFKKNFGCTPTEYKNIIIKK